MEKIYMENNNDNKNKRKKSKFMQVMQSKVSNTMSLLMILVAFASFLAISFNQTSYAAVTPVKENLGSTFTTANVTGSGIQGLAGNGGNGFIVNPYYTTTGVPIFCLERDIDFSGGVNYTRQENNISDQGLLYIMANSYPHKTFSPVSGGSGVFSDEVQAWITQSAIWQYLYETNAVNNMKNPEYLANMQKVTTIRDTINDNTEYVVCGYSGSCTTNQTFYDVYIKNLVNNAKAYKANGGINANFMLTAANANVTLTSDEKYYQSSLISVKNNDSDNLVKLVMKVDGPDDTIIVDKNGNVISKDTYSDFKASEFYVKVPVNKVTENKKVVRLSATATYRGYEGHEYKADGAQTVTTVYTEDIPVNKGFEIDLTYTPDVPDTGMNTTQSVYFIGLVILLCGMGIIYANARPRKSE